MDNPNNIVTKLKNVGAARQVLFDVRSNPVSIAPGETKPVELPVREAQRIRDLALRGGMLIVVNESDIKKKRLRLADVVEKDPAQEYVELSQKEKKKTGKTSRPVIRPEITTPQQLAAAMNDGDPLSYVHYRSVALRVLPQGTFPNTQPSKAMIDKALEAALMRRRR